MFTTAQAAEIGIARKTLSGLVTSGAIERLAQGVYRMAGAPEAVLEIDTIRVHWLALGGTASVVAAGTSAAALHNIGDWFSEMTEFVSSSRRTTRLEGVRIRVRSLEAGDFMLVDGMPTMSVERTIADLVESGEDLSLVADALGHAAQRGSVLRPKRLGELLEPLSSRHREPTGTALMERLLAVSGAAPHETARPQRAVSSTRTATT